MTRYMIIDFKERSIAHKDTLTDTNEGGSVRYTEDYENEFWADAISDIKDIFRMEKGVPYEH